MLTRTPTCGDVQGVIYKVFSCMELLSSVGYRNRFFGEWR